MNSLLLLSHKEVKYDPIKKLAEDIFYFPDSLGDFYTTANYSFPSTPDGNPVVLTYNNFTVNTGHTVTVSQRCKGLYLYIKGDLTVNGTLSMTARGAKAAGKYVLTNYKVNRKYVMFLPSTSDVNKILEYYNKNQVIYPVGGVGSTTASNPGVNGACGAGGFTTFWTKDVASRRGGSGTSFSGGAGAGGYAGYNPNTVFYDKYGTSQGADNGGKGGGSGQGSYLDRGTGYGGSGAGNPAGDAFSDSYKGTDGTGGLLILIVDGNINISGSIQSNGSKGGDGHSTNTSWVGCSSGAGSGGGAIHIFSKEFFINTSKISVVGGSNGSSNSAKGKSGGTGSINIVCTPKFEETLVGKWIDGKSIYKTRIVINNTTLQGNNVGNNIDILSLNFDTIIKLDGTMQCKSETYSAFTEQFKFWCQAALQNMVITVVPTSFNTQDKTIIDMYYTKSGKKYNGDNIFSTEETLIGTTVNGESLYRKVVELTNPESINTIYTTDISDIEGEIKIVNFYGFYGYGNYGCQNINYHSLSRMWLNTELKTIYTWIGSSNWVNPIRRYAVLEYTKGND